MAILQMAFVENDRVSILGEGTPAAEAANITAKIDSIAPGRGLIMGDKYLKSDDGEKYEYKFFAAVAQWRKVSHGAP
jgi:hypothetical protein